MKKLILLFALIIVASPLMAASYFTCNSPSGTNLTTDPAGGGTCNVGIATWNQAANIVIVRNGTTLSLSTNTLLNLACDMIVETGATLQATGNNVVLTITNGSELIIDGTLDFSSSNNCSIIIASGGTLIVGNNGQVLNNGANTNSLITLETGGTLINNGSISATGPIELSGTVSGSGSIASGSGSVTVTGNVVIEDNIRISTTPLAGTGTITVKRNFQTSTTGWVRIGFPVLTGTAGDLVATGFTINLTNTNASTLRVWNANTSQWNFASSTTPLSGNAFALYVGNAATAGRSIATPAVSVANLNNSDYSQVVTYHNGVGGSFVDGVIDGWNHFYNPFQAFIDWSTVTADLTSNGNFNGTAVYVWNGSGYTSWNTGGTSAAQWIAPHQAFFLRTISGATGTFTFTNAMRSSSPGIPVSTFKASTAGFNIVLSVNGEGKESSTEIVHNSDATLDFDGNFDAYYLAGNTDMPALYSLDQNGNEYSLNQFPQQNAQPTSLAFEYYQNNKTFTIALDQNMASSLVYLMLEDTYTNTFTDLLSSDYTFSHATAAPTNRFKVHYSPATVGVEEFANEPAISAWFNASGELQFEHSVELQQASVKVYSINGQLVAQGTIEDSFVVSTDGVYVVNIMTADQRAYTVMVVKM